MNQPPAPDIPPIGLPPEQFAAAFPFHLAVDRNLILVQAGAALRKICPDVTPGAAIAGLFLLQQPEIAWSHAGLIENQRRLVLLRHRTSDMLMRGQFVPLPDDGRLVFLGSPWFTDSAEIARRRLGFEDFALHDPIVDMLQVLQAQKSALSDAKRLLEKLSVRRAELKMVNARLTQQEAETRKLAQIAARTNNAVILTNATGRIEWINEGFTRLTGYTLEEVRDRKPGDFLQGPETDPATVRQIGEQLRHAQSFSVELINYRKDGSAYWVAIEVQPMHDAQGRLTHFMAIEWDITERRRAEQALQHRLRHEQAMSSAALVLRQSARVSAVLDSLLRVLLDASEWDRAFILKNVDHPEHGLCMHRMHEQVKPGVRALISEPVFQNLPYAVASPTGGILDLMLKRRPYRGPTQQLPGAERELLESVGIRDILFVPIFVGTQCWGCLGFDGATKVEGVDQGDVALLQNTADLIGWHISAEQESQAKTEFLATVSHELRTPLTSLRGFLQTLLADPEMPAASRQEFLGVTHGQAVRLSRLVDDLLSLTSLESGRIQFQDELIDLKTLAGNCVRDLASAAAEKSHQLKVELAETLPAFAGDPVRLASVFSNLLGNAVKFTPPGGTIQFRLQASATGILITVCDTGPGIPAAERTRIFEKFHRVHRRGVITAGTGLGLPIVKSIVDHYGGRIDVESEEGRGSCFKIHLPLSLSQGQPEQESAPTD